MMSESENEVEAFEITDYDLENEFNPNRRFRQTREQAIYGLWAERDSDEEGRPSFSKKKSGKRQYTAPVDFVSGGVKQSDGKIKKEEDKDGEELNEEDEEVLQRVGLGLGPPLSSAKKDKVPAHKVASYRAYQKRDGDFGTWEKHTRGIGQKLLLQMGYQPGKGLGKNKQGISTPVEAVKRKGKGALGAYGPERTKTSLKHYPVHDSEEEEDQQFRDQLQQWKKTSGDGAQKLKYRYKTVEELKAGADKVAARWSKKKEAGKVKVIDMTGREQRVLSGYDAISQRHDKPESDDEDLKEDGVVRFDLPELRHNLDIIVDMSEQAIIQNDKQLQYERDMAVTLRHEEEKLAILIEQEAEQLKKLREVVHFIESLECRTKEDSVHPVSLTECAQLFKDFQDKFYEEYKVYELNKLSETVVFPLVKKHLTAWDPFKDSTFSMDVFQQWKDILEEPGRQFIQGPDNMDSYQKLVWEIWMVSIREAIMRWNVRNPDRLIELLENWLPLIPSWIMDNIMEQLVYPKLHSEIENWNPLTDTMPVHSWIHPWLPLMGNRLEPLYGPMRNKLANALTNWHPSDPSALLMLLPWAEVFSQGTMDAFLCRCILPKLQLVMQEFNINPHQQHLDAWKWVMDWEGLLPHRNLVTLLEKAFFPKWMQVLQTWLNNNPNYEEITKWYLGWKSMFSEKLLADPFIKDNFNRALEIMNRAVTSPGLGAYQPGARENIAYLYQTEKLNETKEKPKAKGSYEGIMSSSGASSTVVPSSFREMIERRAEENGLIFVPIPNRTQEGKPVYKFGSCQIYIDRKVIFWNSDGKWLPIALGKLVEKAI